ncbi:RodZ domain-containing protein [Oceanisphaera arctica]|uniref:Helix-turn-helix domain-containing protein n=1 Tax=Oceanisphaera arctica TaxID=641510 RepID=A0A2P5TQ71_9GAMM|nr:RodZ domain-containing protein [Oceanisphaera arctica]PPL17826.1 helix-turn-helix domain-containing protein [Oceanisphaera arctica]GHA23314.1 XRE family transcriptional regulator [Oceanisphaera arctica]
MTINEADPQPQAEPEPVTTAGPGALLREAREAKGWTQAEVARRLNLRLAVIESIDGDQYKAGVALTFLRGYVKAYAKVVGVKEQEVLAAFDGMSGIEQIKAAAPMQSFSRKTRQQASDNWLKRISWLVLLGLLGSLVYWWWQDSGVNYMEPGLDPNVQQQEEPAPEADIPVVAPQLTLPAAPITDDADTTVEATPDTLAPVAAIDEKTAEVTEPTAAPAVATIVETETPAADPRLLAMNFTDDCWIKVTDGRGRVLAEGVQKARQALSLKGEPPFRLILGAPHAASVEYMNKAVDLSSFSAGRVARLTVPKS